MFQRIFPAIALAAILGLPAQADTVKFPADAAKFTVGQCLDILAGLNALNFVGQQLADQRQVPPTDARPYKLGATRLTLALDMAALRPIADATEKARQGLLNEIGSGKPIAPNSEESKRFFEKWQDTLNAPCPVTLGRIKAADLKIGDGPDDNPIPPAVLSALVPIIDQ